MLTPKSINYRTSMMRMASVAAVAFIVVGTILIAGCGGGEDTGTVNGRVMSAQRQAPVPVQEATVTIGGKQGVTDVDGAYTITGVPIGVQEITVTAPTTGPDAGKYQDYPGPGQAPVTWDVVSGEQTIPDILLALAGGGPPGQP